MAGMQGRVALITGASSGIGRATAVVTDVSHARDVERMVASARDGYGRLDYAVNNAGIEGEFASITRLALSTRSWASRPGRRTSRRSTA